VLAGGSDGAHVQICRDRACATVVTTFDAVGSAGAPASALPAGVLFWRAYGRSGGATGQTSTPVWQFTVGARSAPIDTSWGTTLDVNGDGYADVVVGSDQDTGSNNATYAGRAYVYMGSASGLATKPAVTLVGPDVGFGMFGHAVASAGDVNGDGYADVVVGYYNRASVYVYLGGPSGLASTPSRIVVSPNANSAFGYTVTGAGDVNGDGYADILVGAYVQGYAYILFGSANGIGSSTSETLAGPDTFSAFGEAVASVGDLNGDGYADIVVGASSYGPTSDTGRAYVYYGSAAGVPTSPTITLDAPGSDEGLGSSVSGTDVNGDGYADLLVGAIGADGFFVYFGAAGGLAANPDQTVTGPAGTAGESFPYPVSAAGDVNGDGYADVIAGSDRLPTAFVYLGSASGLGSAPASPTPTNPGSGDFGLVATGIGDVDGDGYADVMVSGFESVFLFKGSAAGVPANPATTLTVPSSTSLDFGVSVASAESAPTANPSFVRRL
jgi:hypothetical protein